MVRTILRAAAVTCFAGTVLVGTPAANTPSGVQSTNQATPDDAAPFMGDWTLALQGPDGPGTFGLLVAEEEGKVVGALSIESMPTQRITDVSRARDALLLSYTFTYDGMPVDAVVSLTPDGGGPLKARVDFAGGAYTMSGTATKKESSKP
jgi:hypothetical protein